MESNLIINIGILETLTIIVAFSGTLIALAWRASGRLTRVETLIEGIDKRLTTLEGKTIGAFKSQSPIALTEQGLKMLEGSGLKGFVDDGFDELKKLATEGEDLETSYDIQTVAFDFFNELSFDQSFQKELKQYAFENGISMEVLRRVAGIYFRDKLLTKK